MIRTVKKTIAVVLIMSLSFSIQVLSRIDIEASSNELPVSESVILDKIAEDWIYTCDKVSASSIQGMIDGYIDGKITSAVKQQSGDDLMSIAMGETYGFALNFTPQQCISMTNEKYRDNLDNLFGRLANTVEETEKKAIQNDIKNILNKSDSSLNGAGSVMNIISKNIYFAIGLTLCSQASICFQNALNSSDLSIKEKWVLKGAKYGGCGCQISMKSVDALYKNPEFDPEKEVQSIALDLTEFAVNCVIPEFSIVKDTLEITCNITGSMLQITNRLANIDDYLNGIKVSENDYNKFFNSIVNYYGDYEYEFSNTSNLVISKYNGFLRTESEMKNITIPTSKFGYTLYGIGNSAFEECKQLKEVTIPSSVKEIEFEAFRLCTNLNIINYNAISAKGALSPICGGCDSLKVINFGDGIKKIPENFFANSGLEKMNNIPNTVETIGHSAFEECKQLKEVTIPSSVKKIEFEAFRLCTSLHTINYNAISAKGDSRICDRDENLKIINYGKGVKRIPESFFYNSGIEEMNNIPNTVETIGNSAFYSCKQLKEITIPKSVKSIGSESFLYCNNLSIMHFNAINAEGSYFTICKGCDNLKNILIGDLVESIPKNMFAYSGVENIIIPKNVKKIEQSAFSYCASLLSITVLNKNCDIVFASDIPTQTVITCLNNSLAHKYALSFNRQFILIENDEETTSDNQIKNPNTMSIIKTTGNNNPHTSISTKIKKIKTKKKSIKLMWKKVNGVNGYQIKYSIKKNFKKSKIITIKKASTTSKTIKKLKRKKKYYVRIRTFILANGKPIYSAWSKTKSKKTK